LTSLSANYSKLQRRPLYRLVSTAAGLCVAAFAIWQSGVDLHDQWKSPTPPMAIPVANATTLSPGEAIGLAPPPPKGNDSSISPVPLAFTLVRVHPGRNANEGSAEIGTVRESPQTYQCGALLGNGARLEDIHSNYVTLEKDGQSARLYLANSLQAKLFAGSPLTKIVAPDSSRVSAVEASHDSLTDYIRPSPVYDGQSLIGYQVYPGARSAPFTQMGLRPGDVIVKIGDSPLSEPSSAIAMLNQLAEGAVLSVSVKRQDVVESLQLDGSLITRAQESFAILSGSAAMHIGNQ